MFSTAALRSVALTLAASCALHGFVAPPAEAQGLGGGPPLAFETFDSADGLPHDVVYGLAQDRDGFLWAATQVGLARFDGRRFAVFRHDPDDPTTVATDNASDLLIDGRGRLWIGTWGAGLDRFDADAEHFTHHAAGAQLPDLRVQSLFQDRSGRLWLGCFAGGLSRFDDRTGLVSRTPWSRALPSEDERIWDLVEDDEGRLWVATDVGVAVLSPGAETIEAPPSDADHPLARPARTLALGDDGDLFVGTENGLLRRRDDGSIETVDLGGDRRVDSVVNTVVVDRWKRIWVGTAAGLVRLDPPYDTPIRWVHDPRDPRSIGGDDVRRLLVGRGDILWIATRGAGLSRVALGGPRFRHIRPRPSEPGALGTGRVIAFAETEDQHLWVATDRGAYAFDGERFTSHLPDPDAPRSLPTETVNTMTVDASGRLWLGVWRGGICRADPDGGFTCYRPDPDDPDSPRSDQIWRLHFARDGTLWIAHRQGIDRMDPTGPVPRFEALHVFDGLIGRSFLDDPTGHLWIGSDQRGLLRFRPETGEIEQFARGMEGGPSADRIHDLFLDRDDVLWVATDRGLDRWRDGGLEPFPARGVLPGRAMLSIVDDVDGYLWVGTDNGLARVDPRNDSVRAYTTDDGLPPTGFRVGATLRDRRGHLYFGGFDGYVELDPTTAGDALRPSPLVLTRFQVLGAEPIAAPNRTGAVSLAPGEDSFIVEYAALDVVDTGTSGLRHRLDGLDTEWVDSENGRATYARVDPGHYVFRVQTAGRDGVWREQGLAVDVVLRPPFWATPWFRIGGLFTFVGCLALIYQRRVGELQHREQELQDRIDAALGELQDSEERVRRAQKLESLAVLAGGIAHDFNNLLTGVLGQIDLVRLDLSPDARDVHIALDRATEAAERAAHLSTQMLAYSGQGAFEVVGVDLPKLVRRFAESLREELGEGPNAPRLDLHLGTATPPARADSSQIEQLLDALVTNAIDAGGLRVEISTAGRVLDASSLERMLFHDWARPGAFAELAVRDDGDGVDPTVRERLFEPFFTTRGAGRGLGLAVVLGIVRGHGGALDIDGGTGQGTTLRVALPVERAQR
ncbi:MAG: two-component regulator propeller domain-containing protein [Acidobacteriota bacterium]